MPAVIGIDIGTTGTKAVLADENLKVLGHAYRAYGFSRNDGSMVEQDARDWWSAVADTVRECAGQYGRKEDILAICVSSQGATMVPVGRAGEPLAPAVVWMDTRAGEQGKRINDALGESYVYKKTGWRAQNCFNLLQILWMKDNLPTLYEKTDKFLSTNEFVNFKLSGEYAGDPTNAGISQLFNIVDKQWDADLLALCGIGEERLARVLDAGKPIGRLTRQAASELGLSEHTALYSGGHDQYLAAVGSGAVHCGDVLLSCGTSWGVNRIGDRPQFSERYFYSPGRHAVEGLWGVFAYTPAGGAAFEWLRSNLSGSNGGMSFEALNQLAEGSRAGAGGLLFLPHFAGSSCPTWRGSAKAALLGLDLSHGPEDVVRAYMEGVGYEIRWILQSMGMSGLSGIKSLGGGSKSRVWMQVVADITGLEIVKPVFADAPVMGAAIVAGIGSGLFESAGEAYRRMGFKGEVIEPDMGAHSIYDELFAAYQEKFELLNHT